VPKAATEHPAAIMSQRRRWRRLGDREVSADRRKPEQTAGADQEHDDAGIGKARESQRDLRASKVNGAIEDVRTRHQNHAGAERDQCCCSRQLETAGDGGHDTRDQRRAKRLEVVAEAGQPAADELADRCAPWSVPVSEQERRCQRGRLQCRLVRQRPEARCFPFEIGQLRCAVQ
jgi:hypothetical protein